MELLTPTVIGLYSTYLQCQDQKLHARKNVKKNVFLYSSIQGHQSE